MASCRTSVAVLLVCLTLRIGHSSAWKSNEPDMKHLPQWDYWQPLPTRPVFTGKYLSSSPNQMNIKGQRFKAINLFELDSDDEARNQLLYGSILFRPKVVTDSLHTNAAVQAAFEFLRQVTKESLLGGNLSPQATVTRAILFPLHVTADNGATEMVILQEYQDAHQQTQRFRSQVTLGTNVYLTIEDPGFGLHHHVVVALDRDGVYNLFQYRSATLNAGVSVSKTPQTCGVSAENDQDCVDGSGPPRILSFNVWNTNPSNDVYGHMGRWSHYNARMDHLARIVDESRANIIGFQEVRYDGVFGEPGEHAQVQHLASRLPGFQFVYQAAMSYINARNPYERIEEGPAIFSRFPIVSTDHLLLSRNPNDPNDMHQRLCLHAVVDHPQWGLIDVYVTHLSLSERSREQTMLEIWEFMQQGKGVTQVLLGDLNAEPQSRGIRFLRGDGSLAGRTTDLKDAWLEKHSEAEPKSEDPTDRATKFTFPSDNPSKRIDFAMYRGKGHVKECEIIGQEPTEETKDFPRDMGMLNAQSRVYASDHRGVVVEFEIE